MFDVDKLIESVVGGPDYVHGRALLNKRRRAKSKDPIFMGWIDFDNGRASIAMWPKVEDDGTENRATWNLTIKPFGAKVRAYTHGQVTVNEDRRANVAPHFMGSLEWGGETYSVAMWFNPPEEGREPFFAVRLRLQKGMK